MNIVMFTKHKAFTLVELLISIVIVGILAGVIFATYRTILDITIRVENEKLLANEMLFAHQTIQSLVDNYTIDYSKYGYQIPGQGTTETLYLTGRGGKSDYIGGYEIKLNQGAIILIRNTATSSSTIPLTDSGVVTVSGLQFQIIPYNLTGVATGNIPIGDLYFAQSTDIYHPAFWMRGMMYIRNYKPTAYLWSVKQPIQSFFNIRSY